MSSGHEIALAYAWLTSTLTGDSTLMSYSTGGCYRALAPNDASPPWLILSYQSGLDSTTMNAYRMMSRLTFQVKIVGPVSVFATQLAPGAERIDVLLGGPVSGTTTGGDILSCYRESALATDEIVDGVVWSNIGGLYHIDIEQTS